jgi:transcription elongation factor GreB
VSKAFTRKSDADPQDDGEDPSLPPLPAGARNDITPKGYADLRAELFSLMDDGRPKVVEIVHLGGQQWRPF